MRDPVESGTPRSGQRDVVSHPSTDAAAEQRSLDEQQSPYLKLPAAAVAGGLCAVLAILLAIGVYANHNLRGPDVQPASTAAVAGPPSTPVIATPASTPGPTVAPAGAAATTVELTVTVTSAPLSVSTATRVVTATSPLATATLAPPTPTAEARPPADATSVLVSGTATPLPTVEPTLAAEVGQDYENFWRVRSDAALSLDASRLPEVMDGPYLEHFEEVFTRLRSEGRAIQTVVSLNYTVVQASDSKAIIHDRIEDRSYYVQLGTDIPLSDPSTDVVLIEFELLNIEGHWKVENSVTQE